MVIGIDPGLSGAIAVMTLDGYIDHVYDAPVVEVLRGGKKKRELDFRALADILAEHRVHPATIEIVGAMPKQGASSVFSFGRTYGGILGVCAALHMQVHHVAPQSWKKTLHVRGGKDASRLRASELFPDASYWWPLAKHDGRAEAALIAYYGHHHRT